LGGARPVREKTKPNFRHFPMLKNYHLPRQARDKSRREIQQLLLLLFLRTTAMWTTGTVCP
jgi:hypothetical protein